MSLRNHTHSIGIWISRVSSHGRTVCADNSDDEYGVSFNDGPSAYWYARSELEFPKPDGNYQVWLVQRSRLYIREDYSKEEAISCGIRPRCTFDSVSGRYFPFA